ncbi:MAG: hypothetical protein NTV48_01890, partial [Candidatus Vogelbacteria bacterium]|nr:hypothetical protein [Candidatus Vogelbacteria bacterium]
MPLKDKNKRLLVALGILIVILIILGMALATLWQKRQIAISKSNFLASVSAGAPSHYLGAPDYSVVPTTPTCVAPQVLNTNTNNCVTPTAGSAGGESGTRAVGGNGYGGPGEGGPTSVPVNNIGGESGPHDATDECGNQSVKIISPANGAHLSGNFDVVARAHLCQRPDGVHISAFHTVVFSNNGTTLGSTVPGSKQTYFSYLKCSDNPNDWCATVHFVQISPGENTVLIVGYGANGQSSARDSIKIINDTPQTKTSNQSTTYTTNQNQVNSNIGTLNAFVENGYMYIYGPMNGYLGLSSRIINLYAGNYVLYARSRYSGRLCYNRNISI